MYGYRELGNGGGAMLRSPSDLGSEEQGWVELAGCSVLRGFFTFFFFWATKNQFFGIGKVENSMF